MREINRTIVSALIFSSDGKLLMGRKDPREGGVYPTAWHIPGGGVDQDETLEQALAREIKEEVGMDINTCHVVPLDTKDSGTAEKTLQDTGERVLCHMEFNYFEVHTDTKAEDTTATPSDDLMELRWFSRNELPTVEQIPGGAEFFRKMGYMD